MIDGNRPLQLEPKTEFESDLDYWIRKNFGGRSSGRRLKRLVAKFGAIQLLCGLGLTAIAGCENSFFPADAHFSSSRYGSSLLSLMFLVSLPTLLMGLLSMLILRYWTSLTSNRQLLVLLARVYALACIPIFGFHLWCLCVLFLTFRDAKWMQDTFLRMVLPYFVFSVVFEMITVTAFLYYAMDLSYLSDEAQRRESVVLEPANMIHTDPTHTDLSNMDTTQAFNALCVTPCLYLDECSSLIRTVVSHGVNEVEVAVQNRRRSPAPNILSEYWQSLQQWWQRPGHRSAAVSPTPEIKRKTSSQHLEALTKKQELDIEAPLVNEPGAKYRMDRGERRREKETLPERETVLEPDKQKVETPQESKPRRRSSVDPSDEAVTLTVSRYKSLWSSLEPAGSFQCPLREAVSVIVFTEHLTTQGFHIVFTSSPTATDSEVGICNIRSGASEPWFLARFLFTRTSLSAVMKCQDRSRVKDFVRNFALARVLKIDMNDVNV